MVRCFKSDIQVGQLCVMNVEKVQVEMFKTMLLLLTKLKIEKYQIRLKGNFSLLIVPKIIDIAKNVSAIIAKNSTLSNVSYDNSLPYNSYKNIFYILS